MALVIFVYLRGPGPYDSLEWAIMDGCPVLRATRQDVVDLRRCRLAGVAWSSRHWLIREVKT